MATGTQLYDKEKVKIYPYSKAELINTSGGSAVNNINNVEDCLADLYTTIAKILGDEEAVNTIRYIVTYCRLSSKTLADAEHATNWSESFILPTAEAPYVWKKTVITYAGAAEDEKQIFYEIVASDIAEKYQTIYKASSSGSTPEIYYPVKRDPITGAEIEDDKGNKVLNLEWYDNKLPDGWLETPQPISPSFPYVFMSTRKRIEGKWEKFSDPAQFGRWAFDSQLELRYQVTQGAVPDVSNKEDNPGEAWLNNAPTEFTGKLWMITATSVNGVINSDAEGVKWRGPNLLAIIQ